MDYLQYYITRKYIILYVVCFKPYYKWITFNILTTNSAANTVADAVLNLIINGLPSISKKAL